MYGHNEHKWGLLRYGREEEMQALVLALKEKFKQMENMLKKVEEKSLVWVGEEQTEKQTRSRCLTLTVK